MSRDQRVLAEILAKGKIALVLGLTYYSYAPFIKAGLPVAPLPVPKEGVYVSGGSGHLVVLKNAPHPNATRLFLNWFMSREGQEVYTKAMHQPTRRLDVDSKWLREFGVLPAKDHLTVEQYYKRENQSEDKDQSFARAGRGVGAQTVRLGVFHDSNSNRDTGVSPDRCAFACATRFLSNEKPEWDKVVEAAKKEGRVVVSIPTSAELRKEFESGFQKAFPGIELELNVARGASNINKIAEEQSAGVKRHRSSYRWHDLDHHRIVGAKSSRTGDAGAAPARSERSQALVGRPYLGRQCQELYLWLYRLHDRNYLVQHDAGQT